MICPQSRHVFNKHARWPLGRLKPCADTVDDLLRIASNTRTTPIDGKRLSWETKQYPSNATDTNMSDAIGVKHCAVHNVDGNGPLIQPATRTNFDQATIIVYKTNLYISQHTLLRTWLSFQIDSAHVA